MKSITSGAVGVGPDPPWPISKQRSRGTPLPPLEGGYAEGENLNVDLAEVVKGFDDDFLLQSCHFGGISFGKPKNKPSPKSR